MNSKTLTYVQNVPATSWNIVHDFDNTPISEVLVHVGNGVYEKILPFAVRNVSSTLLVIEFSSPTSGRVRLSASAQSAAGSVDLGQSTA